MSAALVTARADHEAPAAIATVVEPAPGQGVADALSPHAATGPAPQRRAVALCAGATRSGRPPVGLRVAGATGPGLLPLAMVARRITAAAHLILSGPSVARIDYDQCVLETVMGVNGSIALRQRHPACASTTTPCWMRDSCVAAVTWWRRCCRRTCCCSSPRGLSLDRVPVRCSADTVFHRAVRGGAPAGPTTARRSGCAGA